MSFLAFSAVVLALFYAGTFVSVVDALRTPRAAWVAAEQSRNAWIGVMLVLPITFVAYWGSIRPQLRTPAS